MLIKSDKAVRCYHCGDKCESEAIVFNEKNFCCTGCKLVFEILSENDLCDFYQLSEMPGISIKGKFNDQKFEYLANKDIQQQLLQFQSSTKSVIMLHIPVIHCSSCIWLLENLGRLLRGVYHSRVNFPKKSVTVTFDPSVIQLRELVTYLARLGYEPQISMEEKIPVEPSQQNQDLLLKIGIAGFCFGNIMLLSFPEYLGFTGVEKSLKSVFAYLSAFLSLPVLYAGSSYLVAAYQGIRERFFNIDIPIALGILTLWLRSCYEIFTATGPGYFDSLAGLVFFLLIGKWFQSKTYRELLFERDYKSYFPLAVDVQIGNSTTPIPVRQLKRGDVIIVKNNEIIPADSELISDQANIDYSFVTGESAPQEKFRSDHIYAGGKQKGVSIMLRVKKAVSQSYLTQLWNDEAFEKNDTEHQSFIDKISKYFTVVILAIALISAFVWYWTDPSKIVNVFTAVLIVACPCALALSAPFTLGTVTRIMGKAGLYLKNAQVIEKMSALNTIVFDKTGTITHNDEATMNYEGKVLNKKDIAVIKAMVSHSSHPLSKILSNQLAVIESLPISGFQEIEGKGLIAYHNNKCYKLGAGHFVAVKDDANPLKTSVYVSISGEVLGKFTFSNKYRNGLKEIVKKLQHRFKLNVLSGDNDSEADNLKAIFGADVLLSFNKKPDEKLHYLKNLQAEGKKAMMIGDGLNDAGALKQSDVGIVLADDVNNFTPASDGILDAKSFQQLPALLKLSTISKQIIYASFTLSFIYNALGLSFAVAGMLTPVIAAILMPISSISVVLFTTFLVNYYAKRLKLSS